MSCLTRWRCRPCSRSAPSWTTFPRCCARCGSGCRRGELAVVGAGGDGLRPGRAASDRGGAGPGRPTVNYPEVFAELTAATARLLAAGTPDAHQEPMSAAEAPRALAARGAMVGEV